MLTIKYDSYPKMIPFTCTLITAPQIVVSNAPEGYPEHEIPFFALAEESLFNIYRYRDYILQKVQSNKTL